MRLSGVLLVTSAIIAVHVNAKGDSDPGFCTGLIAGDPCDTTTPPCCSDSMTLFTCVFCTDTTCPPGSDPESSLGNGVFETNDCNGCYWNGDWVCNFVEE
jgi:hypothetical protein